MSTSLPQAPWSLETQAGLAAFNTFRLDAQARVLARLHDATALPALLDELDGEPLILGGGSNVLLVRDALDAVLVMDTRGVVVEDDADGTHLVVAAGERWDDFVRWTLGQGLAGLENLILIPGTVGAAPMQNIGAYGVEVAEFVESVEAWDTRDKRVVTFDNAACDFAYRNSRFKRERGRYIITAVRFFLPRQRELRLDYAGLRQQLARMSATAPTPYLVAEAVQTLRLRKLPDPAIIGNAGSFFKNPIIDPDLADALRSDYPDMKQWATSEGVKLSAAWLIDQCGLKGMRQGDAGISNRHALVLVNHGQASGQELWALARRVIDTVQQRFGITLEPEPLIVT